MNLSSQQHNLRLIQSFKDTYRRNRNITHEKIVEDVTPYKEAKDQHGG